ncbi:MAG TPA: type VI secretion protein IcmF/TssM N-terminal domain-containing protein [Gemmatales bacterium]|nr:type VI secretion protein IcmF/TssM N-terminal domain-containing protein [Gemmatales bacterium]
MGIIARISTFFSYLLGLLFPVFASVREMRDIGPKMFWLLHFILLVAAVVLLYLLNQRIDMSQYLQGPLTFLRPIWIPVVFLTVYALLWVAGIVWRLLNVGEEASDWPDIDEAWEDAAQALRRSRIDWSNVPVFVVLGRPHGGEDMLFKAGQPKLPLKNLSRDASPIQVFACPDAIFLTCPGASLLALQSLNLGGQLELGGGSPAVDDESKSIDGGGDIFQTMAPTGQAAEALEIIQEARARGREVGRLTEEEKHLLKLRSKKKHASLLRDRELVERTESRLKHICKLLVRERRPFCPINGVLLLLPVAAADSDDDAQQTAQIAKKELDLLRTKLQMNAPVLTMICDIDTLPGFDEFIGRFPPDQRQRRVGQRFPVTFAASEQEAQAKLEEAVSFVCQYTLPTWVFKLFSCEGGADGATLESSVEGNTKLFRLMSYLRMRSKRLGQLVRSAVVSDRAEPLRFAGCYLAGTGNTQADQAFIPGVFHRLIEEQDNVSWTNEALREDVGYHRITRMGYLVLVLIVAGVAGLGGYQWFVRGRQ